LYFCSVVHGINGFWSVLSVGLFANSEKISIFFTRDAVGGIHITLSLFSLLSLSSHSNVIIWNRRMCDWKKVEDCSQRVLDYSWQHNSLDLGLYWDGVYFGE
jgi:hypothetical protein